MGRRPVCLCGSYRAHEGRNNYGQLGDRHCVRPFEQLYEDNDRSCTACTGSALSSLRLPDGEVLVNVSSILAKDAYSGLVACHVVMS